MESTSKLYMTAQNYAKYNLSKQVSEILGTECSSHYLIDDSNWRHFDNEFDILIKIDNVRNREFRFSFARSETANELLNLEGVKDLRFH